MACKVNAGLQRRRTDTTRKRYEGKNVQGVIVPCRHDDHVTIREHLRRLHPGWTVIDFAIVRK